MRVQHNIMALNANRNLGMNNSNVSKSLEKLSSGYRINRAADDAAGLAISEKMRAQISCLTQAETNCQDGISLIQTAEGALTEVHDMLNRMVELAEQSANGTYTDEIDRENLQDEVLQLQAEIDRIADSTNFNGIELLDGSLEFNVGTKATFESVGVTVKFENYGDLKVSDALGVAVATSGSVTVTAAVSSVATAKKETISTGVYRITYSIGASLTESEQEIADRYENVSFIVDVSGKKSSTTGALTAGDFKVTKNGLLSLQIGESSDQFNILKVAVNDMHVKALGVDTVDVGTQSGAQDAVKTIKDAINQVSSNRGKLGAMQNRLEHTVNNLSVTNENITNAESRIRDTDMAKEMMTYTSKNILSQAAQSMLAQANQVPQQVLSLLQ